MTAVHVVVPDGIDDPARPSGGNAYDRRLCRELIALGWTVHEHAVSGGWPRPGAPSVAGLAAALNRIPDGALAIIDGLVACAAPGPLADQAGRLRVVALVHMPLGHRPAEEDAEGVRMRERAALAAATAVVTTSAWARGRLLGLYPLDAERVRAAPPGVDPAELAAGTAGGGALLCVAAVTAGKGHDVLIDALATVADLPWRCVCVGSLEREPAFARELRERIDSAGLGARVCLSGPRTGADLDGAYAAADLLVLASRAETYGMVVTEGLARGLPVLATEVGGLPEALGRGAGETRPGLLVTPGDPGRLAAALRAWLTDDGLRARLRRAARERRASLLGWPATASLIAGVLEAAR